MIKLWIALAFLGLHFYIYAFLASTEIIPARESFEKFPLQLDDWVCSEREEMDTQSLKILGASDYFI